MVVLVKQKLSNSSYILTNLPPKERTRPLTKSPTRPPKKQLTNPQCVIDAANHCGSAKCWGKAPKEYCSRLSLKYGERNLTKQIENVRHACFAHENKKICHVMRK